MNISSRRFWVQPNGHANKTNGGSQTILRMEFFQSPASFNRSETSLGGRLDRSQGSILMKRTVVRYKTKPDMVEENERLIGEVFEELWAKSPDGVRYLALKLGDGTFIHFVVVAAEEGANPIQQLEAFGSFQSAIKERCVEPPQSSVVTIVGNYRMLGAP
jgi:hypothetical protein